MTVTFYSNTFFDDIIVP